MQIQRIVGVALLVAGLVLLVMGIRATDSFSSQVSDFFTGSPSDRAIWLMVAGVAGIAAGATLAMLPTRVRR